MNNDILRQYAATAANPEYKGDWDLIDSKFPELKGFDKNVLRQYAATAKNPEYKSDWSVIDSKFPELFGQQQEHPQVQTKSEYEIPSMYGNDTTIKPDTKGIFTPEIAAGLRGEQNPNPTPKPEPTVGDWFKDLGEGMGGTAMGLVGQAIDLTDRVKPENMMREIVMKSTAGKEGFVAAEAMRSEKAVPGSGKYIADLLINTGKTLSEKGYDYFGQKDFTDLWKEGNYAGAVGNIILEGGKSLPTSVMAFTPIGLGVIGAGTANEKYNQVLTDTDASMLSAAVSGVATGAFELLSEKIGAGLEKKWLKNLANDAGKDMAQGYVKGLVVDYLKTLGKDTLTEGLEEASSQFATNVVDVALGIKKPEGIKDTFKALFDDVLKSGVYGMGGGAFGGATLGAGAVGMNVAANAQTNRQAGNQPTYQGTDVGVGNMTITGGNAAMTPEVKQAQKVVDKFEKEFKKNKGPYFQSMMDEYTYSKAAYIATEIETSARRIEGYKEMLSEVDVPKFDGMKISKHEYYGKLLAKEEDALRGFTEVQNAFETLNEQQAQNELVQQQREQTIQQAQQDATTLVESISNNGQVISATLKGVEGPINVVKGTILLNEDGSLDRTKSEKTFIYKTSDGKSHPGNLDFIEDGSVSITPSEEAINQSIQPIKDQIANDEAPEYEVGSKVVIKDKSTGFNNIVTVTGRNEDGTYSFTSEVDGKPVQGGFEAREVDQKFIGVFDNESPIVEYTHPDTGETLSGIIDLEYIENQNKFKEGGYAVIDGQDIPLDNIKGRYVNEELSETPINLTEETPETVQNGEVLPSEDNNVSETAPLQEETAPVETPKTNLEQIPTIENKGKVTRQWEQAAPETTLGALREAFGDDAEVIQNVEAKVAGFQKRIEKAAKPRITDDIDTNIANKAAQKIELEQLNQGLDYWNSVRSMISTEAVATESDPNEIKHNGIVSEVKKYNETPNSYTEQKRSMFRNIQRKAQELGYVPTMEKGNLVILKDGKPIRTIAQRQSTEEINSHDELLNYPKEFQTFVTTLIDAPEFLNGLDTRADINKAINDIVLGNKSVSANTLLDDLEAMFNSGFVQLRRTQFSEAMKLPLAEYMSELQAPITEVEQQEVDLFDDDVFESVLGLKEFTEQELNDIKIYLDGSQQTEIDTRTEGTSEENIDNEQADEQLEQEVQQPAYANGDEVSYQGEKYIINGVGYTEGETMPIYDLEDNNGKLIHSIISESELNLETLQQNNESKLPEMQEVTAENEPIAENESEESLQKSETEIITGEQIERQIAEQKPNINPTESQKEVGNYKKAHVVIQGMDISIENPKGSIRSGVDQSGKEWSNEMLHHYGYFKGTVGRDNDHVDTFIGDNPESTKVFVVDQITPDTGEFDESKVMLGFSTAEEAKSAYLANYDKDWKGFQHLTEVGVDEFKTWLYDGAKQAKPFAEYRDTPVPVESGSSEKPTTQSVEANEKVETPAEQGSLDTLTPNLDSKEEVKPEVKPEFKGNLIEYAKEVVAKNEAEKESNYGKDNKVVSNERYEELKRKMKGKLGNLNVGFDPETFAMGAEMAAYHIEAGARTFADFTKRMIADLGEGIKPYLKAIYNGARDLPGMEKYEDKMDEYKSVKAVDIDKLLKDEIINEDLTPKEDNSVESIVSLSNKNNDNGSNKNSSRGNKGTKPQQRGLSLFDDVESGTPASDVKGDSKIERVQSGNSSSELGARSKYDLNKAYTNEEIAEIASSVTEIKDGKIIITGEVTDDVKDIVSRYVSGGIAKQGRGILDEYYTDSKIVDAVTGLISEYFPTNKKINALEPSVGLGNFVQAIPKNSTVTTFEINEDTARIAKILNLNIEVNLRSFETEFIDDSGKKKPITKKYSLVVGNPPYGEHRGVYKGLGEESKISKYEDYFVKRSLDVLEEGGIIAMVLPSTWMNRHSMEQGYTIENAYRLPSGAFESTQVGTDIVILKKNAAHVSFSKHNYFENNPDHVLGEIKERSNRFGKMEQYVSGDIETALSNIDRIEATKLANEVGIEATSDNLNDIAESIEEVGTPEKAKKVIKAEKKQAKQNTATVTSGKVEIKKGTLKYNLKKGDETVAAALQFDNNFTQEEIEAFKDTDYAGVISKANYEKHKAVANFHNFDWVHDFYYAEGNIYEKLEQLEIDKANMDKAQYDKQKKMLKAVLPKSKTIDKVSITPNTEFVKNLELSTPTSNTGRMTLKDMFERFVRTLPRDSFGDSTPWEVVDYVNNNQVYGQDKHRNALVRERRKKTANNLFKKYLTEEISDSERSQIEYAFNREYNAVYRPDYSKVPLFSTINKNFKGKPLKLAQVQLAGVGRMTVKGVGVLAHEVGFGKTLTGTLSIHEALTRGTAKKPLIIAPNDSVLKQWIDTIHDVLPESTVNVLGNLGVDYDLTDFNVNDKEITLVTYEGFKAMGFKDETYDDLSRKFNYISDDLKTHKSERDKQKKKAKDEETKGKMRRGMSYSFEDFGFDHITFDEVHNANHIVGKVKLDKKDASDFRSQSQRTSDLGIKTWLASQYIQEQNNGRNVVLLSATPFTNKPLEYYSILSLVANSTLERMGFYRVDQFFETFMEADNDIEIKADGTPTQKTNVRRFKNNGLFNQLLSEYIDIKGEDDNPDLVRPQRHNREYKIPQNELTQNTIAEIQQLFESNESVLQGITHSRLVAFSPYASSFCPDRPKNYKEFVENSPKILTAIKLIEQNKKDNEGAGQLMYSEIGVEYFPMIQQYLIDKVGYKENEVRIISGATSLNERAKIQNGFNKGDIKVIIGSPAIKEGINLQENTTDMYILSLPYNFTQLRQVEGRSWRQGNKWSNIRINYMLTDDSVDVFLLQRLQVKQGLYNESMKSGAETIDVGDIDTSELKTALITNPETRANIELMIEKGRLEAEKTRISSDLAFILRKYEKYNELRKKLNESQKALTQREEWAKTDTFWGRYIVTERNNHADLISKVDQEKQSLAEKGVNVDDINNQEKHVTEQIAEIDQKIEGLKERFNVLVDKYTTEKLNKANKEGDVVKTYIKERATENKGGYYERAKLQATDKVLTPISKAAHTELVELLEKTGLAKEVRMVTPEEIAGILDGNEKLQAVWHGSPHKFDKFSLDKIGTGEGRQAFGWGLYFTNSKEIAKAYAERLAKSNYKEKSFIQKLFSNKKDKHIYEADINNSNWIRWDKPITEEQSIKIASAIHKQSNFVISIPDALNSLYEIIPYKGKQLKTGEATYRFISKLVHSDKNASIFLNKNGFSGIKYPANYHIGNVNDRDFNFVVFDDMKIKLTNHIQFLRTPSGTIYGFVKGGVVYLNAERMNANSPIHEFGHLLMPIIKEQYPEFYAKGAALIKESPYYEQVKNDPNYSHLDEDGIIDEAMNQAIGDKGEKATKNGLGAKLKAWIKDVWERIGKAFGIKDLTSEQIQDLTLEDWTDIVNAELLSGKKLKTETPVTTDKITIDGVERHTKNSNGKPIHSTEEGVRNFYKWFGESKVVDAEGRPLVVYHGTKSDDFNSFNKERLGENTNHKSSKWGFAFTPDIEYAKGYSHSGRENSSGIINEPFVKYAYLSIKNPKIITFVEYKDIIDSGDTMDFKETTMMSGFEGVIIMPPVLSKSNPYYKRYQSGIYEAFAFSPNQIKSATGNNGDFSAESNDIRYQIIGEQGATQLDKAEESTMRLDNLEVAREMEKGKAINDNIIDSTNIDGDQKYYLRLSTNPKIDIERKTSVHITPYESIIDAVENDDTEEYIELDNGNGVGQILNGLAGYELESDSIEDAIDEAKGMLDKDANSTVFSDRIPVIYKGTFNDEIPDGYLFNPDSISAYISFDKITESAKEYGVYVPKNISILYRQSYTPEQIRLATGWERGKDLKWRYEVADVELKTTLKEIEPILDTDKTLSLSDVIDISKYPYKELSDYKVEFYTDGPNERQGSFTDVERKVIGLRIENTESRHEDLFRRTFQSRGIATGIYSNDSFRQILLHEVQHIIQHAEGFARGGAVEELWENLIQNKLKEFQESDSFQHIEPERQRYTASKRVAEENHVDNSLKGRIMLYERIAGETESRNVQSRMSMSAEERRNTLLSKTEDVAREDQLVLMEGLGVSQSVSDKPVYQEAGFEGETVNEWAERLNTYNGKSKAYVSSNLEVGKRRADLKEIANLLLKSKDKSAELRKVRNYIEKNLEADIAKIDGKPKYERLVDKLEKGITTRDVNKLIRLIDEAISNSEEGKFTKMLETIMGSKTVKVNDKGVSEAKMVGALIREDLEYINQYRGMDEKAIEDRINEIYSDYIEANQDKEVDSEMTDAQLHELQNLEILKSLSLVNVSRENIKDIKNEIVECKAEIKNARELGSKEEVKNLKTRLEALEEEALDNQKEFIAATKVSIQQMQQLINTGKIELKDFIDGQKERKSYLNKMANSAVANDKSWSQEAIKEENEKWAKNILKNSGKAIMDFLYAPFGTFNTMLKYIDTNHIMGEGRLYKHFMMGKEGAYQSDLNYKKGMRTAKEELEEAAKRITGKSIVDVVKLSRKTNKEPFTLTYTDKKGVAHEIKMNHGELLYLYAASKMKDGRIKLEKMGLGEVEMEAISEAIPKELRDFQDWVQEEFLPSRRVKYNETHKQMFGTSMSKIEGYFPFKYDMKEVKGKQKDITEEDIERLPSSMTGSIINRQRNKNTLTLSGNAFDILYENLAEMEEWNAFAQARRDVNTLINNKFFANSIDAKSKGAFGLFREAAKVAVHSYQDKTLVVESGLAKANRMYAAGAIAFRLMTALKQVLSYPAFMAHSIDPMFQLRLIRNLSPDVVISNWKWAMESLPGAKDRWDSQNIGDEKILQQQTKLDKGKSKIISIGMFPNRLVDVLTVIAGSKSIYDYEYSRLSKTMSSEQAKTEALMIASIAYNSSQQSALDAFLSPMQKSGTFINRAVSTFMNNSFAYARVLGETIVENYRITFGNEKLKEKLIKDYVKQGHSEEYSKEKARKKLVETFVKNLNKQAIFGIVLGTIWKFGVPGLLGALGDDDDEVKTDLITGAAISPIDGTVMLGNAALAVSQGYSYDPFIITSELRNQGSDILNSINKNGLVSIPTVVAASTIALRFGGINLDTFESMYDAVDGIIKDGANANDFLLLLNTPKSIIRNRSLKYKEGESLIEYAKEVKKYHTEFQYNRVAKELVNRYYFSDDGNMTKFNRFKKLSDTYNDLKGLVEDKTATPEQVIEYDSLKAKYTNQEGGNDLIYFRTQTNNPSGFSGKISSKLKKDELTDEPLNDFNNNKVSKIKDIIDKYSK